jgi:hypothetical protein
LCCFRSDNRNVSGLFVAQIDQDCH